MYHTLWRLKVWELDYVVIDGDIQPSDVSYIMKIDTLGNWLNCIISSNIDTAKTNNIYKIINIGHNRNTKKEGDIFISNLHPETTSFDVMKYLRAEYNEYFKI